ncbi:MAG: DUF4387 family protein [Rhodobacteraceae bacterium]|nr:DUF4387 family protein [Paracoccaceae bacterium]
MSKIRDIATKVRSKNAGPFWVTIDIFCGSDTAFDQISQSLSTARVAAMFRCEPAAIKRFDIGSLNVVKFSFPRPQIQGAVADRDMHGAAWAPLLAELDLN